MALFAVAVTLVLLFLAFGSVVLPVKAVLMNALSLAAMLGVVVWVFQEGNGAGLFGFTPTGVTEATQPILMVAIAFGLSMDYEVFLLSRMREQWDLTGDNALAVERGLARTGRIITSAALLFVVVVGAFAFSGLSLIAAGRRGAGHGGPRRRHGGPGPAGAGDDEPAGPVELVGAGPDGPLVGEPRAARGRRRRGGLGADRGADPLGPPRDRAPGGAGAGHRG